MNYFKIFAIFLVLIVPISASNVVLVSDTVSDCASANIIPTINDSYVVINTSWGVYDDDVLEKILNENPENVIIVGGTVAVPSEYDTQLEDAGITVERIYGLDRYQTNKNVLLKFKNQIQDRNMWIVYGDDDRPEFCSAGNYIVVLSNGTALSIDDDDLEDFDPKTVTIMETPVFNSNNVMSRLQNQGFSVSTQAMPESVLNRTVYRKMEQLQLQIETMEQLGINCTPLRNDLNSINNSIRNQNLEQAYAGEIVLERNVLSYKHLNRQVYWNGPKSTSNSKNGLGNNN
ncbi:cell wall-binding repeat-containing protein [Methanococcus sp. CF]